MHLYVNIDIYIYINVYIYILIYVLLWIDTANNNMITWIYLKIGYTWVYSIPQIYTKYTKEKKMITVTNQFRGNLLSKGVAGCGSALFHKVGSSHTFWKMIKCIEKKGRGGCCERHVFCIFDISFLQKIPNPVLSKTKHYCLSNKGNHCAFSTALPMSYTDT